MEGLRLGLKDLDVDRREQTVRGGKGGEGRLSLLPQSLVAELPWHLRGRSPPPPADRAAG